MLGPIVAFGVLAAMPDAFDVLFVASFAIAIVGVVAIVTFVPAKTEKDRMVTSTPTSVRTALALFVEPRFKPIAIAGSVLGVATMSDAFVFLVLQRRLGISAMAFPLLYVGTSLFTSVFSVPCGRLADRFGPSRILLAGYCVLALVYTALLLPATLAPVVVAITAIALLGAYYSATDGVLTAMAAAVLPGRRSGSGLSLLATATNGARLLASVAFGWLWTVAGPDLATVAFLGALAAAIAVATFVLVHAEAHAAPADTIELARAG